MFSLFCQQRIRSLLCVQQVNDSVLQVKAIYIYLYITTVSFSNVVCFFIEYFYIKVLLLCFFISVKIHLNQGAVGKQKLSLQS